MVPVTTVWDWENVALWPGWTVVPLVGRLLTVTLLWFVFVWETSNESVGETEVEWLIISPGE